ncbi:Imm10 family immunity protein [Pseudoduganella sp. HUAS MS19]
MNFNFFASEISSKPVDGIWTVGFADSSQENYLLIQRDVDNVAGQHGLNVHYIEFEDQSRSCYGGIERVQILRDAVRFRLSSTGAQRIGMAEIVVSFTLSKPALASMSEALAHIVEHGRVEVV